MSTDETKTVDLAAVSKAVEGLNKTWTEQKAAQDEMAAEVKKFGTALPETEAKLAKMEGDMVKLQEIADQAVLAAKRASRVSEATGDDAEIEAKALKWAKLNARRRGTDVSEYGKKELDQYNAAFGRYMREGDRVLGANEEKALSVGVDPDGGYVVSPDMSGRMVSQVYETSVMRAYASVQTISTDALEGLYDNDEAGYEWNGETTAPSETDTPQLGKWRIPVHDLSAMPKATQRILDDAEINIEQWLAGKVADRFSRAENEAFVVGDGSGKPRGFLTYPNGTDLATGIEQFKTTVNGGFAAAPNGGDVLISALYGLKAVYKNNATWFMNRATQAVVRKLKNSDGDYIWSPGIAAGQPASLLGYSVAPSFEDMPDPATGSLSIAVGDMRQAYQIVDRAGIRVLRDPYTAKPFVIFYTTKRTGGDMINGEALKIINFAA